MGRGVDCRELTVTLALTSLTLLLTQVEVHIDQRYGSDCTELLSAEVKDEPSRLPIDPSLQETSGELPNRHTIES